jgi:hypothetical protein
MKLIIKKVLGANWSLVSIVSLMSLFLGSPVLAQELTINVEVDYMADTNHSHELQPDEVNALVQMFACHGITLNVDVDDSIPHIDVMECDPPSSSFFTCSGQDSFATIKADHFDNGTGWHYCVFGHDYDAGQGTGSSGIAEIGGRNFVVTLGSWDAGIGTPFQRAATFAHELGHNLNLRHWSPLSSGEPNNFPPNYASIMSYQYQMRGVRQRMECLGLIDSTALFKNLDYSNGRLPYLVEFSLSENLGVGIHNVDWDCDGNLDATFPVSQDLDSQILWCSGTGDLNVLRDFDDWNFIGESTLNAQTDVDVEPEIVTCITASEFYSLQALHLPDPSLCPGGAPTLTIEPCSQGEMIWVDSSYSGSETGTGDQPYSTLFGAYFVAPVGSVLYLQPGTFTNNGSAIILLKRLMLAGPGGAVIDP